MYEELKKIIDDGKKIVFFGGAGVSTESNIPDFRSADGLYNANTKYGMSPEALISHSYFMGHMQNFFEYYKENMIFPEAKPNKAHLALAKLEQEGKLIGVVTQNIDGLHQVAGSKKVYELHGSVRKNRCMDCGKSFDLDYVLDPQNCDGAVPKCDACGGVVKPVVVLYEEALDDTIVSGAVRAISDADVMIVGGTSLVVYPAAGLINYFRGKHLVLINRDATPYDSQADLVIHDSIGKVLGEVVGV
ncbi:MAG: NAD-dependent protein deacylase [Eubacteriaceae bacterium]|jgi:NAD-dependent deacetylase|nr:NAD-dependent protein deacylase [Eubacteriaceae bacterium]